jgi:hypothetical protein
MFDPTVPLPNSDRARLVGRGVVFLWFLIGGIAHFVATDTEALQARATALSTNRGSSRARCAVRFRCA